MNFITLEAPTSRKSEGRIRLKSEPARYRKKQESFLGGKSSLYNLTKDLSPQSAHNYDMQMYNFFQEFQIVSFKNTEDIVVGLFCYCGFCQEFPSGIAKEKCHWRGSGRTIGVISSFCSAGVAPVAVLDGNGLRKPITIYLTGPEGSGRGRCRRPRGSCRACRGRRARG